MRCSSHVHPDVFCYARLSRPDMRSQRGRCGRFRGDAPRNCVGRLRGNAADRAGPSSTSGGGRHGQAEPSGLRQMCTRTKPIVSPIEVLPHRPLTIMGGGRHVRHESVRLWPWPLQRRSTVADVADDIEFPFRGWVIWLTAEQGGRDTGAPSPRPAWPFYAATAYVPPHTADDGLASFVLRNFDAGAWRSGAEGRWLLAGGQGDSPVVAGSVIAVTEGSRLVAYFTVEHAAGS
jgi:hypothetical protein